MREKRSKIRIGGIPYLPKSLNGLQAAILVEALRHATAAERAELVKALMPQLFYKHNLAYYWLGNPHQRFAALDAAGRIEVGNEMFLHLTLQASAATPGQQYQAEHIITGKA